MFEAVIILDRANSIAIIQYSKSMLGIYTSTRLRPTQVEPDNPGISHLSWCQVARPGYQSWCWHSSWLGNSRSHFLERRTIKASAADPDTALGLWQTHFEVTELVRDAVRSALARLLCASLRSIRVVVLRADVLAALEAVACEVTDGLGSS